MSITKKNHFNPCLWMAIWNKEHYGKISKGEKTQAARDQLLHYLEINSNKNLVIKAENIHYEKNLGIAELPKDKVLDFCRRHHPDKLDEMIGYSENDDDNYILDFEESLFTGFERVPIYESVIECARTGYIKDDEQRAWISMFLTHHVLRSPQYLDELIEKNKGDGIEKFETLITLKWSLEGKFFLTKEIMSVYTSQWTIYKIDNLILPLSDFPIIAAPKHILAPLGPDVLLFVAPREAKGVGVKYETKIPKTILNQFFRETIFRTTKGLIFAEEKHLLKCKETSWWKKRRKNLGLS